jgi:diguanylate cyclase (GGDEF)-like protein
MCHAKDGGSIVGTARDHPEQQPVVAAIQSPTHIYGRSDTNYMLGMIGLGCAALGLVLTWGSNGTLTPYASIFFLSIISGMMAVRASSLDMYFTVGIDAATLALLLPSSKPLVLIPLWIAGTFAGHWFSQGDAPRAARTTIDIAFSGAIFVAVLAFVFHAITGVAISDTPIGPGVFTSGKWAVSVFVALMAYVGARLTFSTIRLRITRRVSFREAMCAIGWTRSLLLLLLTFLEATAGGWLSIRLVRSFPGADQIVGQQAVIALVALSAFGVTGLVRTEAAWHRANALAHALAEPFEESTQAAIEKHIVRSIGQAMPSFLIQMQQGYGRAAGQPDSGPSGTLPSGPRLRSIERCNMLISPTLTAWYGQFCIRVKRGPLRRPFNRSDLATLDALGAIIQEKLLTVQQVNQLSDQANKDPLTGLLNYRGLSRTLRALDSPQNASTHGLALVFLDLDDFKHVNDTYGHRAGNVVLREVGQRIAAGVRKPDVAARIGGDEFVVVLYGVTERQQAESVAARLTGEIRKRIQVGTRQISVNASIGIALSGDNQESAEALLALADQRMYAAKELHEADGAKLESAEGAVNTPECVDAGAIKEGIERGDIHVHYQPIVDVRTGRIVAVAGLVRPGPNMPQCTAEQLVTAAHTFGLADALTHHVFTAAIADFADFEAASPGIALHLNIDVSQLFEGPFLAEFQQWRAAVRGNIVLEINERWIDAWDEAMEDQLAQIIADHDLDLGIDDFGRIRVGFLPLLEFSIGTIKIDKSVIDAYAKPRTAALLTGMVGIAQQTGVRLIFEGVENREQLEFLQGCGGALVQGFVYSQPVPAAELLEMLRGGIAGESSFAGGSQGK